MREILSRAKRKDNGEWVYGYYYESKISGCYILTPKVITRKRDGVIIKDSFDVYEIDQKTLCQFIGMVDKNGNRIWENDIISINTYDYMEPEEDFFGKVVYCEAWACWCIQQPDEEKFIPLCECEGSYQTDRFVEGNVFDNPEMWRKETED